MFTFGFGHKGSDNVFHLAPRRKLVPIPGSIPFLGVAIMSIYRKSARTSTPRSSKLEKHVISLIDATSTSQIGTLRLSPPPHPQEHPIPPTREVACDSLVSMHGLP